MQLLWNFTYAKKTHPNKNESLQDEEMLLNLLTAMFQLKT